MKENRREFLTKVGLAAVGLPIITETVKAETIEEKTDDYFVGMFSGDAYECFALWGNDWSYFFTARTFNNEEEPRIISAVYKLIPNKKIIDFTYLEPTAEEYPESEEDDR